METQMRMECKTGGSNKFYEFAVLHEGQRVIVNGYHGAIGQAPKHVPIYDGDDAEEAQKALDKKVADKLKGRYLVVRGEVSVISRAEYGTRVHKAVHDLVVAEECPIVWPMAAVGLDVDDDKLIERFLRDPNYFAQEKIDGMRATLHVRESGLRIFSRNGGVDDPSRPLDKTQSLPHLAALKFPEQLKTVFDSELGGKTAAGGDTAAETCGRVNSKAGADGEIARVFDIIELRGVSLRHMPLEQRLQVLEEACPMDDFIELLPYARTYDEKLAMYQRVRPSKKVWKGEGLMFKHRRSCYEDGSRRVGVWYKLKKNIRIDAVIMGFTKGEGKYSHTVGAIRYGQYVDGKLKELGKCSGMEDALREEMGKEPDKFINMVIVVKGQERLKSGALRHGVFEAFRADKLPKDCVAYPGEC